MINLRENMFVFTLDANDIDNSNNGTAGDNYLNCMCVWFYDLAVAVNSLYCVQKAMCFVTVN